MALSAMLLLHHTALAAVREGNKDSGGGRGTIVLSEKKNRWLPLFSMIPRYCTYDPTGGRIVPQLKKIFLHRSFQKASNKLMM